MEPYFCSLWPLELFQLTKLWISGIPWQLSSVCNFQWILVVPCEGHSSFPSSISHREHPGTKIRASPRTGVPWNLLGLLKGAAAGSWAVPSPADQWCRGVSLNAPAWLCFRVFPPGISPHSLLVCLSAPLQGNRNNSADLASSNHCHEFL